VFGRKIKRRLGVTLVELIIAVTVLAIAVAGIVTVFHVGFQTSTRAHDLTIAGIEAQMQMEVLAGRPWIGTLGDTFPLQYHRDDPDGPPDTVINTVGWCSDDTPNVYVGWNEPFESNGLWVKLVPDAYQAHGNHSIYGMTSPLLSDGIIFPTPGVDTPQCPDDLLGGDCEGGCSVEYLRLIQVALYVFMSEEDARDEDNWKDLWAVRHSNIFNVREGRLIDP